MLILGYTPSLAAQRNLPHQKYTWRDITSEIERYAEHIWTTESTFPKWFLRTRAKDFKTFKNFLSRQEKIYGLFNGYRIVACVYVDSFSPDRRGIVIHMSLIGKMPSEDFIKMGDALLDKYETIRGFVLGKNFPLRKLLKKIGFKDMPLVENRCGYEWKLMERKRNGF
jgi:hypothetical protein